MAELLLYDLFAAMDIAVLERTAPGSYVMTTPPPSWLTQLWPGVGRGESGLQPGQVFTFLDNFLIDAEHFWQANTSGQIRSGSWYEADANGVAYHLEATALSLAESKLLLLGYPLIDYQEKQHLLQKGRDISLLHERLQQEIQKKEMLLHCIVHDLKGPLTVMKGTLSLLASYPLSPEQSQALLRSAEKEAGRQEHMIADILAAFSAEMEALEAFSVDPGAAPNVAEVAQTVVGGLQPTFSLRNVQLQLAPLSHPQDDWRVLGERLRLERIFSNLLENALRYSPPESTVTIGMTKEAGDVLVTIDDQGPGVPAPLIDTLFNKFSQGQGQSGTAGLGLYFCRMTIERWGGSIGCSRSPLGGARFSFRLPQPASSTPLKEAAASPSR